MELTTVSTAIGIVSNLSKAMDALRERAKSSKDAALKEGISKLYDEFLNLKELIARIAEENAKLKQALAVKAANVPDPEIRQVGLTNYYFVGEQGPYCQKCYDKDGKLVSLQPRQKFMGGPGRKCVLCGTVFFEEIRPPRNRSIPGL